MRAVVQRVLEARVSVDGEVVGQIAHGLLAYVGVRVGDTEADARKLADKIAFLRVFADEDGKMNRTVQDVRGGVLAVPNFTLLADARKGRRPAFTDAARPEVAAPLHEAFVAELARLGCVVATGRFRTHMAIHSVADGPVNIVLDVPPCAAPEAPAGDEKETQAL